MRSPLSYNSKAERQSCEPIVIMDMDGVVTCEKQYWKSAFLTVFEVLFSKDYMGITSAPFPPTNASTKEIRPKVITDSFIAMVKKNGVNSNWDLAFLSLVIYLSFLDQGREKPIEINEACRFYSDNFKLDKIMSVKKNVDLPDIDTLAERFFLNSTARINLNTLGELRDHSLWQLTRKLFDDWYHGREKDYKRGLMRREKPVIPLDRIKGVLASLKTMGYRLAIATGRPSNEILPLLDMWKIISYFDRKRIATFDTVSLAEKTVLRQTGKKTDLSKPSPYIFLWAALNDFSPTEIVEMSPPYPIHPQTYVVGDAASDLIAANAMGAISVLVCTGIGGRGGAELLKIYNPKIIIDSIAQLPDVVKNR